MHTILRNWRCEWGPACIALQNIRPTWANMMKGNNFATMKRKSIYQWNQLVNDSFLWNETREIQVKKVLKVSIISIHFIFDCSTWPWQKYHTRKSVCVSHQSNVISLHHHHRPGTHLMHVGVPFRANRLILPPFSVSDTREIGKRSKKLRRERNSRQSRLFSYLK